MYHLLKKSFYTLIAGSLFASYSFINTSYAADTIFGIHGEFQYWNANIDGSFGQTPGGEKWRWEDDKASRLSLSLNHFIPLVPNVMLEKQSLSTGGQLSPNQNFIIGGVDFTDPMLEDASLLHSNLNLDHDSLTLYYRLFDNSLIQFYFGATAKRFSGSLDIQSNDLVHFQKIDYTVPMGYLRLTAGLPFTGLSVRAQGQPISFGSHDAYDIEVALRYELFDAVALQGVIAAGYRSFNLQIEDKGQFYTDLEMKGPFINFSLHF